MNRTSVSLAQRHTAPLLLATAAFIMAGGFVHLREWLETYRQVPASAAGAAVVRIGFPLNAAASLAVAAALVVAALRGTRFAPLIIVAAFLLQAGSLAVLILTRTGTFLGWTEPVWTIAADQSRAVEIGALVCLAAATAVAWRQGRGASSSRVPSRPAAGVQGAAKTR